MIATDLEPATTTPRPPALARAADALTELVDRLLVQVHPLFGDVNRLTVAVGRCQPDEAEALDLLVLKASRLLARADELGVDARALRLIRELGVELRHAAREVSR